MKIFISLWDEVSPVLAHEITFNEKEEGKEKFVFPIDNPLNRKGNTGGGFLNPVVKLYFEKDNSDYEITLDKDVQWGTEGMHGTGYAGIFKHHLSSYDFEIVGNPRAKKNGKQFWNLNVNIKKHGEFIISEEYLPSWEKKKKAS